LFGVAVILCSSFRKWYVKCQGKATGKGKGKGKGKGENTVEGKGGWVDSISCPDAVG
jgi:hypothetical protein